VDPPNVERWDFEKLGLMTIETIREMFTPISHFRVSKDEFPAGVEFAEASREGACYVLRGQMTYCHEETNFEISISAGQFANLPSGSYWVSIGKKEAVSIVRVWQLPTEFWSN